MNKEQEIKRACQIFHNKKAKPDFKYFDDAIYTADERSVF